MGVGVYHNILLALYIYMCVYVCVCVYMCVYICVCIYICVCVCIYMCVCMCVYIYIWEETKSLVLAIWAGSAHLNLSIVCTVKF